MRETERLAKKAVSYLADGKKEQGKQLSVSVKDADTKALEGDLSAATGMKVIVNHQANTESGNIIISYKTLEQLDDLCRVLSSVD